MARTASRIAERTGYFLFGSHEEELSGLLGGRAVVSLARTPSVAELLTIRSRASSLAASMLRLLVALLPGFRSALRSRRDLVIENLALRQQLATLAHRGRPDLRPADRVFWILLLRIWSSWAEALAIVRPDTVVHWHRAGFRIY